MDAWASRRFWGSVLRRPWFVLLVLGALALSGCSGDESVTPPRPAHDSTTGRDAAAQRILPRLVQALASRSGSDAAKLGTPAARSTLEVMAANAAKLDLRDLSMRFVDDQGELDTSDEGRYGGHAWPGTVELTYRLAGWDDQPTRLETRFVFVTESGATEIAGIGGGDGRTPLWTTGPVTALSADRTLVVTTGSAGERYLGLAEQALVDVAKVLPGWHGKLVIEAPASQDQLDHVLAAPQEQYANIAAVTTTVDGSLVPGAPVHVFLNPQVFDPLGPRGAQVVISHESTHVATNATFADVPTWLLEGFADYVALAHAGIPVKTAAAQILGRMRKTGPPDHLPTAAELDPTANGLGATYEEAWLATRFLARDYGEDRLVTFYRKVSDGEPLAEAFRKVLGTSEDGFVTKWRADLRDLIGGVEG